MMQRLIFIVLSFFLVSMSLGNTQTGYLTVNTQPLGKIVYLDGDSIGITPIINYPLKPGEYTISLYPSEQIENEYWRLAQGNLCNKCSSLWELTKIGAGTKRIKIEPGVVTEVFFSDKRINCAPTKAKLALGSVSIIGFTIPFILGYFLGR
ncbi:MAG: PEGA domain-containing protein [candidate division WOR-3 bacterium]|nr:PEGA domain-containing protein [candidate division WOR-3 bacterium]MDW7987130.1 PEGA domain-containing protein [candidate division WOR-3 bacterium]